jgi:competence protein ComEC
VVEPDDYRGNILVTAALYPRYIYGDKLKILCQFDFPDQAGYARYLSTRNIFATCNFAKLEKVGSGGGNLLGRILFNWRILLNEKINSLWNEPQASLMAGILYGERGSMPKSLKDNFSNSGLSHIIAVSGYNTSVIALVVMAVFIFIGCWRRQAFWLSSINLILFTLFTGATASVVRAAVMAIFVMLGNYWGRPTRMLNSLLFAAALMLFFNPRIIFDVGFQLSFVATVGVSYVGPLLTNYFIGNKELVGGKKLVSDLFFTTLGALVITLPLTIFYFGKIPILAILANILVVGFIPVIMLLGFLALLLSFFLFPLGLLVAFAADLGLRYIIWVSSLCAVGSVSFSLPLIMVVLVYLLIFFWLYRINKYVQKSKN